MDNVLKDHRCPTHSRGSNEWVPRVIALGTSPSQTGMICPRYFRGMTRGLQRWYGGHDLHQSTPPSPNPGLVGDPGRESRKRRDLFLRVLERARQKYRFVVIGYVVMPEHFHLLITEPEVGNPSVVMKVVKERFTKLLHHGGMRTGPIWQKRFYDFNVCSTEKRIEKLR